MNTSTEQSFAELLRLIADPNFRALREPEEVKAEPQQTYGQWLARYAHIFGTTIEHVENMTRILWPGVPATLLRAPVPPTFVKYAYKLGAQFVKERQELRSEYVIGHCTYLNNRPE